MEHKPTHLSASISRGLLPWAQPFTIQAASKAARKPRAQPVPIGQKGFKHKTWRQWEHTQARVSNNSDNTQTAAAVAATSYFKQTVSHQRDHQLMSVLLPDQGSVLWGVHACEVKHGYIWLTVVVDGIVQRWQLVVCAKVSCLTGVGEQRFLVDVVNAQQSLRLYIVLWEADRQKLNSNLTLTHQFFLINNGSNQWRGH